MKTPLRQLFFQFHGLAAAMHSPFASASYDNFGTAFLAFISLADLVCHTITSPFYSSISLKSGATRSLGSVIDCISSTERPG